MNRYIGATLLFFSGLWVGGTIMVNYTPEKITEDQQFQEELLDITNVFCFNFETFRLEKYNSEFELDYIRPYNPDNLSSIVIRQIPGAIPNDFINKFGSKVKRSFVGVQTIDGKIFQFSGYAIGNTNPAGNIIGNPFIEDSSLKDFYTPQISQPKSSVQ